MRGDVGTFKAATSCYCCTNAVILFSELYVFSDCLPDMLWNFIEAISWQDFNFYSDFKYILIDFRVCATITILAVLLSISGFTETRRISFTSSHDTNRSRPADFDLRAGAIPISYFEVIHSLSYLPHWWSLSRSRKIPRATGLVDGLFDNVQSTHLEPTATRAPNVLLGIKWYISSHLLYLPILYPNSLMALRWTPVVSRSRSPIVLSMEVLTITEVTFPNEIRNNYFINSLTVFSIYATCFTFMLLVEAEHTCVSDLVSCYQKQGRWVRADPGSRRSVAETDSILLDKSGHTLACHIIKFRHEQCESLTSLCITNLADLNTDQHVQKRSVDQTPVWCSKYLWWCLSSVFIILLVLTGAPLMVPVMHVVIVLLVVTDTSGSASRLRSHHIARRLYATRG